MKVVVSVVNFIWSHGLNHCQCKSCWKLMMNMGTSCVIRWLNYWTMLERLLNLKIEIKMFH